MNAGFVSKGLLAKATLLAQATEIGGKAMLDIHLAAETLMSTSNLQTMSDIARYLR